MRETTPPRETSVTLNEGRNVAPLLMFAVMS